MESESGIVCTILCRLQASHHKETGSWKIHDQSKAISSYGTSKPIPLTIVRNAYI